jgi:hypothetical protein
VARRENVDIVDLYRADVLQDVKEAKPVRATEERVEAHMMLTTVVQFLSVTSGDISYSLDTGCSHAGG